VSIINTNIGRGFAYKRLVAVIVLDNVIEVSDDYKTVFLVVTRSTFGTYS
jgi:hypothetical protein